MAEGSVRWFNDERGYGFIVPDDGGPDVRVRSRAVRSPGLPLEDGARVRFTVERGEAVEVVALGAPEVPPGRAVRVAIGALVVLTLACAVTFVVLVVQGSGLSALFLCTLVGVGFALERLGG
ncbi:MULTISPECIES: cold-shock protein [Actinomadura]|uniref:cold-shock protein n=1 Tax=Actinomadura TaxID=1988 RepID=UPI00041D234D|nr:cold shock domain-containing protein [Actinomadura sp. WAC 06369]RSN62315.1 cold-shock protein [Actinomadura sp. WAC 06369]